MIDGEGKLAPRHHFTASADIAPVDPNADRSLQRRARTILRPRPPHIAARLAGIGSIAFRSANHWSRWSPTFLQTLALNGARGPGAWGCHSHLTVAGFSTSACANAGTGAATSTVNAAAAAVNIKVFMISLLGLKVPWANWLRGAGQPMAVQRLGGFAWRVVRPRCRVDAVPAEPTVRVAPDKMERRQEHPRSLFQPLGVPGSRAHIKGDTPCLPGKRASSADRGVVSRHRPASSRHSPWASLLPRSRLWRLPQRDLRQLWLSVQTGREGRLRSAQICALVSCPHSLPDAELSQVSQDHNWAETQPTT